MKKRNVLKKLVGLSMAMCLSFHLTDTCFASERNAEGVFAVEDNDEGISSLSNSDTMSKTVQDSHGNRYRVTAYNNCAGKIVSSGTSYEITYYYGGTPSDISTVNDYPKLLTATGTVSLLGGGSNTYGGTVTRIGKSNYYGTGGDYIYTVVAASCNHGFSCQGATYSTSTVVSW